MPTDNQTPGILLQSVIRTAPNYGIIYTWTRHLSMEAEPLEALVVAHKAVEAASDKQASDVVLLDTRGVCSFADYFVICSGESARQIKTIYEEVEHVLKKEGILPHHYEGTLDSGWLLIDYGDVIVHIFAPFEREFYRLDELWSEATPVVRIQ
ncbi:ribosome silencing factor [Chloroflexota bacterium]